MGSCVDHLRRQDAGRAVERGEGLVVLRHVAADGRFTLDEVDRVPSIRDLQRRSDAGDATADDEGGVVDRRQQRLQGLLLGHTVDAARDDGLGLLGRAALSLWTQLTCSRMDTSSVR